MRARYCLTSSLAFAQVTCATGSYGNPTTYKCVPSQGGSAYVAISPTTPNVCLPRTSCTSYACPTGYLKKAGVLRR